MSLLAKARELKEKAINVAMNYTEPERKVREATNPDEPWGPHGQTMSEIAQMTYRYEEFPEVMGMLWKRMLHDPKPAQWRRIYKSLLLLDHLLANGSERVIETARDRLYDIRRLENFQYTDPKTMKDHGINVVEKSKKIAALIADDEELREVRAKAKANKDKYVGVANPALGGGMRSPERSAAERGFEDEWRSQTDRSRHAYHDDPHDEYHDRDDGGGDYRATTHVVDDDDDFSPRGNVTSGASSMQSSHTGDLLGMAPEPAAASDGFAAFQAAPAPAASSDFGAFSGPSQPAPAAAPLADFGDFSSAPTPAAAPAADFGGFTAAPVPQQQQQPPMGMMGGGMMGGIGGGMGGFSQPQQQQQPQFGGFSQPTPAAMQQQPTYSAAPAASQPPASMGGSDLLGGFSSSPSGGGGGGGMMMGGGMPSSAPASSGAPASKPAASNKVGSTWSGLDISLDSLSLSDKGKGSPASGKKKGAPTSVFGDTLDDHSPPKPASMGGGMGIQQPMGGMGMPMGGMGMGMQQPMGGMGMQGGMGMGQPGMGLQQPMGGMGMGMQQPMGGMGMGMQQPMGGMGMGMQQPMGGMGMQGGGMGMGQPGMGGQWGRQ